jgi:hypothetical protein
MFIFFFFKFSIQKSANDEIKIIDEFICQIQLKQTKQNHFVRLLTFIDGEIMANLKRRSIDLFHSFGFTLGLLNKLLSDDCFDTWKDVASSRHLEWDLKNALDFRKRTENVNSYELRTIVSEFFQEFESRLLPLSSNFRKQLIHGDANDYNVVAGIFLFVCLFVCVIVYVHVCLLMFLFIYLFLAFLSHRTKKN